MKRMMRMSWQAISGSETLPIQTVILCFHHFDNQVLALEVHYKVTKRMEIVRLNVVVCYSYYLDH